MKRHRAVALLSLAALIASAASAQVDIDAGFGVGGVATLDLGAGTTLPAGFVAAPDGSMLLAGSFTPPGQSQVGFVARVGGAGAIDGTFATGGVFTADFGGFTAITGLARQNDGKLVALSNNGAYGTIAMRVLRLTPAGEPDATFSGDGVAEIGTAYAFAPVAAVVQPDGSIVVAANALGAFPQSSTGLTVFRLLGDGTLDAGFKSAGAAGFAVATVSGFDAATALALQPDGKIVVVGSTNAGTSGNAGTRDFAVARFNANGTLDATFAGGGKTSLPVGTLDDDALAVLVQPDNRIVIAGNSFANSSRSNCAIVRLNSDGSLDGSFGTGGIATYNLGALSTCASLTRQGDGTLLAAGSWAANIDAIFMVMRVLADGAPDTSFNQGSNWTWVNPTTPGADVVFAHATQAGGRIVLAGMTGDGHAALARFIEAVPDTTPDPFSFAERTNAARGSVVVSDAITVSGIAAAAPISVTGGEYSVNGAAFTAASGTVTAGTSVRVRHTASLQPLTTTSTTLTVGDVSGVFTSTTEPPRLRPRRLTSGS